MLRRVLRARGEALRRSQFVGIQRARLGARVCSEVLALGVVLGNPSIQILVCIRVLCINSPVSRTRFSGTLRPTYDQGPLRCRATGGAADQRPGPPREPYNLFPAAARMMRFNISHHKRAQRAGFTLYAASALHAAEFVAAQRALPRQLLLRTAGR